MVTSKANARAVRCEVDDRTLLSALGQYQHTRALTESLCAGLGAEDCQIQSAPHCSPIKWHLAHTTWFYDHFILKPRKLNTGVASLYHYLYNSYYRTVGSMTPRAERGLISRPRLEEVLRWRGQVDDAMAALMQSGSGDADLLFFVRLGIEHEHQHQELILMDIKHHFFANPDYPVYNDSLPEPPLSSIEAIAYIGIEGGRASFGRNPSTAVATPESFADPAAFAFDNETPEHDAILTPFAIADRLVNCGEYLAFIEDGGYRQPGLWLADAWEWLARENVRAPLYWHEGEEGWQIYTLAGLKPLRLDLPVSHLSYYEACAYAQWQAKRLPTEYELEWLMMREYESATTTANFLENGYLSPVSDRHYCGNLWQWSRSAYCAYPGFKPLKGSIGEYNGKFMVNQQVLRGGSCVTPSAYFHPSRRNFFYPHERWGFTGLRLCEL